MEEFYPPHPHLRMGQVMWPVVDENETAAYGKSIEKSRSKVAYMEVYILTTFHFKPAGHNHLQGIRSCLRLKICRAFPPFINYLFRTPFHSRQ
jgi:hypothetical protein